MQIGRRTQIQIEQLILSVILSNSILNRELLKNKIQPSEIFGWLLAYILRHVVSALENRRIGKIHTLPITTRHFLNLVYPAPDTLTQLRAENVRQQPTKNVARLGFTRKHSIIPWQVSDISYRVDVAKALGLAFTRSTSTTRFANSKSVLVVVHQIIKRVSR